MASMTATSAQPISTAPAAPDLGALKTKQQAAWSSGDYAIVGTTLQIVGEALCEALDLKRRIKGARRRRRQRQCLARRRAALVRRDLDRLRARICWSAAGPAPRPRAGHRIHGGRRRGRSRSGRRSFDVVLSTFGVMFTPNQDKAAAELLRVCKPKGRIGLANWTPDGFIGQVFKTLGKYLPPPAGMRSPAMWGTRDTAFEMFDAGASSVTAQSRIFNFRYRSADHFLDVFRTYYGPMLKAFAALSPAKQEELAGRPARADRAHEPKRRPHHGGAERISRSRHHQALNAFSGPREPGAPIREGRATSTRTKKSHDRIL